LLASDLLEFPLVPKLPLGWLLSQNKKRVGDLQEMIMFLLTYSVRDGENEYTLHKVVFASTRKRATAAALEYAKDFFWIDTVRDQKNANLYYTVDGTRAIELQEVVKGTTGDLIESLLID
jgi:hypothetical protein